MRTRCRRIDIHTGRDMEGASEHNSFAQIEDGDLVKKPPRLQRNDPSEVVDVVRVLEPVAYEICTLTNYGLADFTRTLNSR